MSDAVISQYVGCMEGQILTPQGTCLQVEPPSRPSLSVPPPMVGFPAWSLLLTLLIGLLWGVVIG